MTLTEFVEKNGIDKTEALSELQECGTVSDNCITLDDVAEADQAAAILLLKVVFDV